MKSLLRALPLLSSLALALALALALVLAPSSAWFLRPSPEGPNVVVVVVDTLRRDHLATYGYPRQTAPFLDGLAREGAVFDGLSPSSWTKPATASLLTGLHPLHHQAVGRLDALPEPAVTLGELLRERGYRTVGASANGWISREFGFGQGFDELLLLDSHEQAEKVNEHVLPLLGHLEPPFFLYVHYIDPHAPYGPRTAWNGGELPAGLRAQAPVTIESLDPFEVRERPAEVLNRVRDLYDGEIRGADRGIEQLVRALREQGLMEDTILVVTSDHGEEIGDHGRMSHGLSLYEEVVRVPLVIHAPGRIRAGRYGLASLLDVLPTLADLVGFEMPEGRTGLDGVSLAGTLRGETAPTRPRSFLFHLDHMDGTTLALARGGDKIVLGRRPFFKELFDLATDRGERRNRLGQGGEKTFARLASDLALLYNAGTREALPRRAAVLDGHLREDLAALGYAAPGKTGDPRRIPLRIVPADASPDGLLGWEGAESLASCFETADPAAERYLLRGWHNVEAGGRWSKPRGLLLLGPPAGGGRPTLVLKGVSYRPDIPRVTVNVAGRPLLESAVSPGEFQLTAALDHLPAQGPVRVEIVTDPPFVPSEHGGVDSRSLGLFLFSACLESGDLTP